MHEEKQDPSGEGLAALDERSLWALRAIVDEKSSSTRSRSLVAVLYPIKSAIEHDLTIIRRRPAA